MIETSASSGPTDPVLPHKYFEDVMSPLSAVEEEERADNLVQPLPPSLHPGTDSDVHPKLAEARRRVQLAKAQADVAAEEARTAWQTAEKTELMCQREQAHVRASNQLAEVVVGRKQADMGWVVAQKAEMSLKLALSAVQEAEGQASVLAASLANPPPITPQEGAVETKQMPSEPYVSTVAPPAAESVKRLRNVAQKWSSVPGSYRRVIGSKWKRVHAMYSQALRIRVYVEMLVGAWCHVMNSTAGSTLQCMGMSECDTQTSTQMLMEEVCQMRFQDELRVGAVVSQMTNIKHGAGQIMCQMMSSPVRVCDPTQLSNPSASRAHLVRELRVQGFGPAAQEVEKLLTPLPRSLRSLGQLDVDWHREQEMAVQCRLNRLSRRAALLRMRGEAFEHQIRAQWLQLVSALNASSEIIPHNAGVSCNSNGSGAVVCFTQQPVPPKPAQSGESFVSFAKWSPPLEVVRKRSQPSSETIKLASQSSTQWVCCHWNPTRRHTSCRVDDRTPKNRREFNQHILNHLLQYKTGKRCTARLRDCDGCAWLSNKLFCPMEGCCWSRNFGTELAASKKLRVQELSKHLLYDHGYLHHDMEQVDKLVAKAVALANAFG